MLSKSTGNIITSIKENKNKVVISFDKDKLEISKDAYVSNFLYVGKVLSKKEIQELEDITSINKYLDYSRKLLAKKHYSEKNMSEKLFSKGANTRQIKRIISYLKEIDLINDRALAYDLSCYFCEKLYLNNKIRYFLEKEGIPDSIIKDSFDLELSEEERVQKLIQITLNKGENIPSLKLKRKLYSALILHGVEPNDAADISEEYSYQNIGYDEVLIKVDYEKLKLKGFNDNKILKSLLNKGYSIKEIKKVMEDENYVD